MLRLIKLFSGWRSAAGADRWNTYHSCCNCSGLVTMALRATMSEVFEAMIMYNEALRPSGGQTERILCCGTLTYLRAQPVSASRWMPRLPRAVVYQHLAQQLLEPETNAELFAVHPDCEAALALLAPRLRSLRLEGEESIAADLCPGDVVVAPPGRGHTGHMYILDRRSAAAWIFIESEQNALAVPRCELPRYRGVRRNVRSCRELLQYWNPAGRPCFVLRLI
eukprot:gnl/TRDRNA2_/TRDRNA2_129600_c0_seq4.p1 gnl/TRDRNA2_/TRDRNA2_129600_c0~~gnl/TRDRNA2_/TRDRNA2_129600_c0_seq4.p1  ORF type:complete len:223 (+),score=20.86 gnl/TRDRNA2_/TRDRNA2_129600_c0_seq4:39-707(+)